VARKLKKRRLHPKTDNQADYIRSIANNIVTLCHGPAGTGKTSVSVGLACEYLTEGKVEKIIITRPVVESGRKGLGYLPGSFKDKIHPYLIPVLEEMDLYLNSQQSKRLLDNNIIEIVPLEYMRGRNFHNAFMILDEAQNATFDQIKMFITRVGRDSKSVINGDLQQSDLSNKGGCDFHEIIKRLDKLENVGIMELTVEDIIRNPIIGSIIDRLS
jgi:phosphate starvation-inducible PhoH-like protein